MRTPWPMLCLSATLALVACASESPVAPAPDLSGTGPLRVTFNTERGDIVLELDGERAPMTVCNFLRYVTDGDYDGGRVFRTVVAATNSHPHPISVIQAATPRGAADDRHPPIPLERTRDTGLSHVAGTVSMARSEPDSATSSFFIVIEDAPGLDFGGARNPDGQGFAAFGRVVEGMELAQAIHRLPADDQENLTPPVIIRSAVLTGDLPAACRP